MRVTFDQPMGCSYAFVYGPDLPYPCYQGGRRPMLLSDDRRTFRLLCAVRGDEHYGLWLNHRDFTGFVSLKGLPSAPYKLTFYTSTQPMIRTVHEACYVSHINLPDRPSS